MRSYKKICSQCGNAVDGTSYPGDKLQPHVTYVVCDYCRAAQRKRDRDLHAIAEHAKRSVSVQKSVTVTDRRSTGTPSIDNHNNWLAPVALILVAAFAYCKASFGGDYEASEGAAAYKEPSRGGEQCESYDLGDNIDCIAIGGECETRDEVDGRWAHVDVSNIFSADEKCWIRYDDMTFQHGVLSEIWFAIFGTAPDTHKINDEIQVAFLENLRGEIERLMANADFKKIVALEKQHSVLNLNYDPAIRALFARADQEVGYSLGIEEARSVVSIDPDKTLAIIRDLENRQFPDDKRMLLELRKEAEVSKFSIGLREFHAENDAKEAAEILVELSTLTFPSDKSALHDVTVQLLERIERELRRKPPKKPKIEALTDSTAVLVSGEATLLSAIAADVSEKQSLELRLRRLASECTMTLVRLEQKEVAALASRKPEQAALLLCDFQKERGAATAAVFAEASQRIDQRILERVRKSVDAYLGVIAARHFRAWRRIEGEFLSSRMTTNADFEKEKRAWLEENPTLDTKRTMARVEEITISACGTKATATLRSRTIGTVLSLRMCFEEAENEWFPCGPIEP